MSSYALSMALLVIASPISDRVKVNRGESGIAVYGWLKDGRALVIPLPVNASKETVAVNVKEVEKYLDEDLAGRGPAGSVAVTSTNQLWPAAGSTAAPVAQHPLASGVPDALDEVNALRARRGLRPYMRDDGLTQGAFRVAQVRAQQGLAGHTRNDFAVGGVSARAGGCGANGGGFMACCVYDNFTFAGAASVRGPDGRVYHQLFVR